MRRFRLASPELRIPMPDRGGRLFSASPRGEAVDRQAAFYARLIAEGSIVPVPQTRKTREGAKRS